ncbi:TonB-dependent receptor [Shewanella sp. OPT22]|nr:TonB-dependent receptor [Shewanella sp. OPT22]
MRITSLALAISLGFASLPSAMAANETSSIEKITVVGSRIAVRSETDTVLPVDVISGEQLQATGLLETSKALQYAVPSFSFPTSAITDGTDAVRPASLRGLSPDHTLVLVNGKRRHGSALVHTNGTVGKGSSNVDLNAIPLTSIKRIEVLRDGAAALYGSDAIAGVINIVLKDNAQGGELELTTGQTYEGDGEQVRFGWNQGFDLGGNGFINTSLEVHDKRSTDRSGVYDRAFYPTLSDGSPDPREETVNKDVFEIGDADFRNYAFMLNGEYALSEDASLYAFGGVSDRKTSSGAFFRRPADSRNVLEVYPDGFLPKLEPEVLDASLYVGTKFTAAEWDFDISVGHGTNEFEYHVAETINASYGPSSPNEFYAGTLSTRETNISVDASNSFDFFNDSELGLAVGVNYRRNAYEIEAGELGSYDRGDYQGKSGGSQGFTGFTPESEVNESRNNKGVYVQAENQLTDDFNWTAALRYENYSDFGSNTSAKLSARYDLTDSLAFRGSIDSGFRAPSVQQLYYTSISTQFNLNPATGLLEPQETGTFNTVSDITHSLGGGDLNPEKSRSVTAGIVFNDHDGFSVTLDAYQIKLEDRIVLSGTVNDETSPEVAAILANTAAENARFFVNGVDTTTKGLELVASQKVETQNFGEFDFSLAYSYKKTEIDSIHLPGVLSGTEDDLFDRRERVRMTEATPANTGNIGFTHSYGDLTTTVRANYFDSYTIGYSAGNVEFGGKWTMDVAAHYQLTDDLSLSAGVQNLFDTYPDERPEDNRFFGNFVYPQANAPFGFNGGYYYLTAKYKY